MSNNTLWVVGSNKSDINNNSNTGCFGLHHTNSVKRLTKADWSRWRTINKLSKQLLYGEEIVVFEQSLKVQHWPMSIVNVDENKFNSGASTFSHFQDEDIIQCNMCVSVSRSHEILLAVPKKRGFDTMKFSYFKNSKLAIKQVMLICNYKIILLIICNNGKVYSNMASSQSKTFNFDSRFKVVQRLKNVKVDHAVYQEETLCFITKQGELYVAEQDCDLDEIQRFSTMIPYFMQHHVKVKNIAAGKKHMLILDFNNNAYGLGDNDEGQLALGDKKNTDELKDAVPIELKDVVHISCGSYHSLLKTINNKYYLFGDNSYGQCINETLKDVTYLYCVNDIIHKKTNHTGDILQIEIMGNNTFVLIGDGQQNDMNFDEKESKENDAMMVTAKRKMNSKTFKQQYKHLQSQLGTLNINIVNNIINNNSGNAVNMNVPKATFGGKYFIKWSSDAYYEGDYSQSNKSNSLFDFVAHDGDKRTVYKTDIYQLGLIAVAGDVCIAYFDKKNYSYARAGLVIDTINSGKKLKVAFNNENISDRWIDGSLVHKLANNK